MYFSVCRFTDHPCDLLSAAEICKVAGLALGKRMASGAIGVPEDLAAWLSDNSKTRADLDGMDVHALSRGIAGERNETRE